MNRLEEALRKIDEASAADPRGRELDYGRRMSRWVERLDPHASEALRLAARAQHIERWKIPRDDFPRDRRGYLKWRTTLYKFHAERAGEILREVGYDDEIVERVGELLEKKGLKKNPPDPEAQTIEDAACLVFLELDLADFAPRHPEEKVLDILRKTWEKMSERGRAEALRLPLPPAAKALIEKALK